MNRLINRTSDLLLIPMSKKKPSKGAKDLLIVFILKLLFVIRFKLGTPQEVGLLQTVNSFTLIN